MDVERIVKVYITIRDKRAEMKRAFDEEYAKLGENLTKLENQLLRALGDNKLDSMRTAFGTVYRQEEVKPSCQDWSALDFWVEDNPQYGASDVFEKRLSKKFITDYMEAHDGNLPAGVSVYREYVARVRRS